MKVRLLAPDDPAWPAFLSATPHDVYHLPAYVQVCAEQEGGTAVALHVVDGDRGLLLPLLLRPVPGGGSDAASPYGYPGPLLSPGASPALLAAAMAAGQEALRNAGIVSAFIRFHPLLSPEPPDDLVGTVVTHGETVSIDLTAPPAVRWQDVRRDHRTQIRRSIAAGHQVRIDQTWSQIETFQRLYAQTMDRVSASAMYYFDEAYFDGLRQALGDRLRLCLVEIGGSIAAAALFTETCGVVQYHLSASDPAFAKAGPAKLMIQHMADWAAARGDRSLHLGGGLGARHDSLFEFKAGFSSRRHPYRTLRLVADEAEYRRLVELRDPGLNVADRTGHFPPYRGS